MGRPYYSKIAKEWHEATGAYGGPLKRYALNHLLLDRIGPIRALRILELGAGNGYFSKMLADRHPDQVPAVWIVSEASGALLRIAQEELRVPHATYLQIDVRRNLPFASHTFDLVVASMMFNELPDAVLEWTVAECERVLDASGRLLTAIVHPEFVAHLQSAGKLSRVGQDFWTMPGRGTLRVPIVVRSDAAYQRVLQAAGFVVESVPVLSTDAMRQEHPGLRHAEGVPLALVYSCTRVEPPQTRA